MGGTQSDNMRETMASKTCAVFRQGYDGPLADEVDQLLLGADRRMHSYGIWSFGWNLLKFQQVWLDQETLHSTGE